MSFFRPVLSFVAPLLALSFSVSAASAGDERRDMKTFVCSDLVSSYESGKKDDSDGADLLLTWMAGYHATEDQGTIVDFDGLKKDIVATYEFCKGHLNIGVLSASEKSMGDNSTAISKDAMDLSTITCEHVVNKAKNGDKDDEEGFSVILAWLGGYYASINDETIVDMKEFEKNGFDIGKGCAKDETAALMTVTEQVMSKE